MTYKKILLALILLLLFILFFYCDLHRFLTLESLRANLTNLIQYYFSHRLLMICGFFAVYVLQTALSLPGAAIMSLAAGAIFGVVMGTIYAVIAATIGATISFVASRYLFRDMVQARFGKRLVLINRELENQGLSYLLFLRLIPLFPFFLINLAGGMTRLPLRTFVIGTLIGITPGGFVYVNAGASLARINSLKDVASSRVAGSLMLLGLFVLLPVLYHKLRKKDL